MTTTPVLPPPADPCVINGLVDAWNSHDPGRVAAYYAPEFHGVDVAQASPIDGRQGIVTMVERYLKAFPDLRFEQEELYLDNGSAVLVWTAHGTHGGPLMNIPATGRRIEVRGVSILRLADNGITGARYIWDVAGLLRNIGLLPELR